MILTDKSIRGLQPKQKRYFVRDSARPGFGVRVSTSGSRTFVYVYQIDKKRRWMTLGQYPDMTLAESHEAHSRYRRKVKNEGNPLNTREQIRQRRSNAPTVADLSEEYMLKWAQVRKKTWKEDARILNKDVLPAWAGRKANQITKRDGILLLEEIGKRGPTISNRTLALINKMFRFGVDRGAVSRNPFDGIKPLYPEKAKDRALTAREITVMWKELDEAPGITNQVKKSIRMILVTAQRPGEVAGMRWEEVEGTWWTIPGERSKNGKSHRVHLSKLAKQCMGKAGEGYVFESTRKGKPIDPRAMSRAIKRNESFDLDPFTPHDLRRTAASQMAEAGIPRFIIGQVLNHSEGSRITEIYDRYEYDKEKIAAMEKWAQRLERILGLIDEDNVIHLGERSIKTE